MGGHALKEGLTRRYGAAEYHALVPEVLRKLARVVLPSGTRINTITPLRSKESFGDMDVLVESDHLPHDWVERIRCEFMPRDMVKNGPVLSFDFEGLQIDVILAKADEYDWTLAYFSWGDTGNLIGRVAHKMGLKFGHDGLWLPFREGDYLFREILVTRDFHAALSMLGFDADWWEEGFSYQEDVFEFIARGAYFDPAIYALENRSAKDRVRDRKRAMYQGFLAWAGRNNQANFEDWPASKSSWLPVVFKAFPSAGVTYEQARTDLERHKKVRTKFDGKRIGEVTGFEGKALGGLMRAIRSSFADNAQFEKFMLAATPAEVDGLAQRFVVEMEVDA
jgi:hypothetical protein